MNLSTGKEKRTVFRYPHVLQSGNARTLRVNLSRRWHLSHHGIAVASECGAWRDASVFDNWHRTYYVIVVQQALLEHAIETY